jgi:hypothetical protein
MAKKAEQKLKYEVIIKEFLTAREWDDELEIDLENMTASLNTGVNYEGGTLKLIIEAFDPSDLVDVFIYYGFNAKKTKLEETTRLMNEINLRWRAGTFMVLPDGRVRWHHRVDFEGSQPTGKSIEQMVSAGFAAVEKYSDVVSAVAITKQTAVSAIEEYDAAMLAEQNEKVEGEEGPNEL